MFRRPISRRRRRVSLPPKANWTRLAVELLEARRLLAVDFGDAPDPYPTTLTDDGARHEAVGPTLGDSRDEEVDGQPATDANGDGADEDGVAFGEIRVGQLDARVTVNVQNAPNGARLDAWIDFNGDGSWGGPFDRIASGVAVGEGDNTIEFDVPSDATSGSHVARFRISTTGGLSPSGLANDGEVEDYVLHIAPPVLSSGVFTAHTITTSVVQPSSVFAADMDGDGDVDVLIASDGGGGLTLHENNGSQEFTSHVIDNGVFQSVYAADMDGDGDLDVIVASYGGSIRWFENEGGKNFTEHYITRSLTGAFSVYPADVDGDGDMDVVASGDRSILWYENDGSQNFVRHLMSGLGGLALTVYAADVDGDGDLDGLSAATDRITWLENDGNQNFTRHIIRTGLGVATSVFAADVDGDGDVDLFSASREDDEIAWYVNDGSERFTARNISTSADGARSVFAADLNGDGNMDVLSASIFDETVAWYENDGAENFTTHKITTLAGHAYSVYAADVDGDGDLDVLSASLTDGTIAWYENKPP